MCLVFSFVGIYTILSFSFLHNALFRSNETSESTKIMLDEFSIFSRAALNVSLFASQAPLTLANETKSMKIDPRSDETLLSSQGVNDTILSGGCTALRYNSKHWLESKRYGNINDPITSNPEFTQRLIVHLPHILSGNNESYRSLLIYSLCHEQSRFLNERWTYFSQSSSINNNNTFDKTVRLWAVRLLYMAIHYHQHRLAIPEAQARFNMRNDDNCKQQLQQRRIGSFDYECGDAKFIVMPLSGNGLGFNVRVLVASTFVLGLAFDRVVLFLNGAPETTCSDKNTPGCPWVTVSCDRRDFQCFFLPTSPCTVTIPQLLSVETYQLTTEDHRNLVVHHKPPKGHEDDKIWLLTGVNMDTLAARGTPKSARQRLGKYIDLLLSSVSRGDPRLSILQAAAKEANVTDPPRPVYNYLAATNKVRHAAVIYAMRPNYKIRSALDKILQDIVPNTFDAELSIGLPIRASDKCLYESECLTFDQHIQVLSLAWTDHLRRKQPADDMLAVPNERLRPTILFTSESNNVLEDQQNFVTNQTRQDQFKYRFDFLSNTRDVTPNSGFMKDVLRELRKRNSTADEMLLGAMSSLKFQLLPGISIGNCCSNFHILLNDFLMEGCGAASDHTFLCLNNYAQDKALNVCCGWHSQCIKDRKQYMEKRRPERQTNNNAV